MYTSIMYYLYLSISLVITVWVARTLSKNGFRFLVDGFDGDVELARSVNHLLVVGFYLINMGFVSLSLRFGDKPGNSTEIIEILSMKIGLVLVVLGVMHFFNVRAINRYRDRMKMAARDRDVIAAARERNNAS